MSDVNTRPEETSSLSNEHWFRSKWRPAMAWQYLAVCLFDFLIAPVLTAWWSYYTKTPYIPWKPISMSEGGFYHMAMAAIVGISAWTRGREKIVRSQMEVGSYYTGDEDFDNETERRIRAAKRRT